MKVSTRLCFVFGSLGFIVADVALAQSSPGAWITVGRDNLCVTEGTIEKASGDRLRVEAPKMRAYVTMGTAQGEIRRQFGLKLHAQDACNLVDAIWRVDPESKLVVSVKRSPSQHSSAECGNRGYQNIKPRKPPHCPDCGQASPTRSARK